MNQLIQSTENFHHGTSQKLAPYLISSSNRFRHHSWFGSWWSWDFGLAFLKIGVVGLVNRIKLFDFVFFHDLVNHLLPLLDELDVVIWSFTLLSQLTADVDAVWHLKQFFCYLGDSWILAFLNLSIHSKIYTFKLFFVTQRSIINIIVCFLPVFSIFLLAIAPTLNGNLYSSSNFPFHIKSISIFRVPVHR